MLFKHTQKKKIRMVLESVQVPAQLANSIKLKITKLWSEETVSKIETHNTENCYQKNKF